MSSGGAREGSGRKNRGKTVKYTITIREEYVNRIKETAKTQGVGIGELIENLIDKAVL